ncbi:glycoside hydrolase superfamily [Naematelia encephala]|uniref:beta-mannosidase n=1 Tax=Naematelia encephala TaxID=71784 RepID=A0A1Y2AW41_9TREE|nr:glycoside hydrolase superfamily [Naematelia encephala]
MSSRNSAKVRSRLFSDSLLDNGWSFTQLASTRFPDVRPDWEACKVPTSVHIELKRLGRIPDPFKGLHEADVQWVGEADWQFKTIFTVTEEQIRQPEKDLVFNGLDTYCEISLNEVHLATTDNMFIPHRVSADRAIKQGRNELVLTFRSPWNEAKKEETTHGKWKAFNGDNSRLFSRKAQYHWGWDWGPVLMTTGPWRSIHLETYTYRLNNIRIDTDLFGPDFTSASVKAALDIFPQAQPSATEGYRVHWVLRSTGAMIVREALLQIDETLQWQFNENEFEIWWPIGYGKQALYTLEIALLDESGIEVGWSSSRIAFRHAKVIERTLKNEPGTTFLFQVNGVRMFCGGSNWIPADSFLTEITPERYHKWVQLLAKGNQNMLRVWGGGVYEDEALYNACDELGILVWQDFMFACGIYPSFDKMNASIKAEAEAVVTRLKAHPSVVIFAGNNEDYQVAEALGVVDYNDKSGDYMNSKFPARHIYEIILPEVVERLSNIHYHRSSPYGGKETKDPTVGDIHQWDIWHGAEPWSNWDKLKGRFVSEFGMQGFPDLRTVYEWDDDKSQLFPQSRITVNHNKAVGGGFERRIELYLIENFRHAFDMPSYVYYTQIMQAECLGAAYRLWRREWRGEGKEYVAGALVWQINDCWPCVSWAIVDYYLRPKLAFFTIARELRPFTLGITRRDVKRFDDDTTAAFYTIRQEMELWACNSTLHEKEAFVELLSFDLNEGVVDRRTLTVILTANSTTEIWKGSVPGQLEITSMGQVPKPIVVQARLLDTDTNQSVLARYSNWPEPWKYLTFPDPGLRVATDNERVLLTSEKPVKGLVLDVDHEGEEVEWSDQAIDLMPGDEQVVIAKGLKGRKVQVRYIGDGSA